MVFRERLPKASSKDKQEMKLLYRFMTKQRAKWIKFELNENQEDLINSIHTGILSTQYGLFMKASVGIDTNYS